MSEIVSDNQETTGKQNIVSDDSQNQEDKVDYKTYHRVLKQHKESKEKADKLEAQIKELSEFKEKMSKAEEAKLKEEGQWTQLLEQRESKISELSEKLNVINEENQSYKQNLDDMVKINAFMNQLGGKLKRQEYYNFVDTSKIVINPETGTVDSDSLAKYANEFSNEFKELIAFNDAKLPNGAPSSAGKISYDEWLKLPLKEKQARQKDVKL